MSKQKETILELHLILIRDFDSIKIKLILFVNKPTGVYYRLFKFKSHYQKLE
jgi:hypothetical protein